MLTLPLEEELGGDTLLLKVWWCSDSSKSLSSPLSCLLVILERASTAGPSFFEPDDFPLLPPAEVEVFCWFEVFSAFSSELNFFSLRRSLAVKAVAGVSSCLSAGL